MKTDSGARLRLPLLPAVAAGLLLLGAPPAPGDDDGIRQAVFRVSYTSGQVAFSRGDDPDHWQEAMVNVPLTLGDRLWADRGSRAELQVPGARVFVAPETQLSVLDVRDDIVQMSLAVGTAAVRLRHLSEGEIFEVDTPNAAVTLRTPGRYRFRVDEDGTTRVEVSEGSALAAVGREVAELRRGDALLVRGLDEPFYELDALPAPDAFDRWTDERDVHGRTVVSAAYVGGGITGVEDLDAWGRWERIPEYGWAWSPRAVGSGWTPYRDGRWIWQDPWGWTWVSREAWGWAPYHYGSWVVASGRWFWVPEGPRVRWARYAPARVVFVGAGPGGIALAAASMAFIGWFPIHPHDRFVPWWGPRAVVTVTTASYLNRSHVTVVGRETFVGGGFVRDARVRDARLVRQISAAPPLTGPIPLVPTTASIRLSTPGPGSAPPRPPERYLERRVATGLPPPPSPPAFNVKVDAIRQNSGRPYFRPETERAAPERPSEAHGAGAPAAGPGGTSPAVPPGKAVARPPKEAGWQQDASAPAPRKVERTPPPRSHESAGEPRRLEARPIPTPRPESRPAAMPAAPAAKPTPRPAAPEVKAEGPPPIPPAKAGRELPPPSRNAPAEKPAVSRAPVEKPAVSKAPAEKPAASKAPSEKKSTPAKKDDKKDHPPPN